MSRLTSLAAAFGVLVALSALAAADAPKKAPAPDWPQFRGPKRDDVSLDKGLRTEWPDAGPTLVWKSEPIGIGFSSVALVGDRIFTMGDADGSAQVFAIDRNTGKKLWSAKVGKAGGNYTGTRCTPTVDGDRVYAIGQFGDLVCLAADSGTEVWRKNFDKDFKGHSGGWQYTESPLVDGDKLICTPGGQKAGALVALDKKTGDVVWQSDFGETAGYSSMVVADIAGVRQYVQLLSNELVGVSAKDGKLLWRYGRRDPNVSIYRWDALTAAVGRKRFGVENKRFGDNTANIPAPVVLGDHIYCAAGYGRGACLLTLSADGNGVKAEEIYFKQELSNKHGGVVVVGDFAYGDREDGSGPQCIEWKSGKVIWKKEGRSQGSGSAAVTYADGHLYVHYANGYVALLEANPDTKKYLEKGSFKIPDSVKESWAHPVVVGGKLYVRDQETVWCYDVTAK